MKTVLSLAALLAVVMVGANAIAEDTGVLEPLYSVQFDDTYVTIGVKSNGCTKPEDFTILASGKGGEHVNTLGIRRDQPDFCKAMPQLIRLQLELPPALAALKEPYWLENPFVSKPQFPESPTHQQPY